MLGTATNVIQLIVHRYLCCPDVCDISAQLLHSSGFDHSRDSEGVHQRRQFTTTCILLVRESHAHEQSDFFVASKIVVQNAAFHNLGYCSESMAGGSVKCEHALFSHYFNALTVG